ncbi:MAG: helical backbone metal receptor [Candidatus Baltobacteraceae bacterium]
MKWFTASAFAAALALAACNSHPTHMKAVPPAQRRVVSLIPSLTEDLFAIGAGGQVVGVSQFSQDIRGAANLPVIGSFASIDTERIIGLHPDVVVGIPAQQVMTSDLRRAGISVALYGDDSFGDIDGVIRRLGRLTGHSQSANQLIAKLEARTRELVRGAHFQKKPSVLVVVNASPIIVAGKGSYIGELIELAGARNAVSIAQAYPQYSAEALVRLQPDVIVTDRTTGLAALLEREPWRSLRAVRQHRIFTVDPQAILERPGPRYNEGLSWLIERLRPLAQ